jgi:hypothetical protein
VTLGSQLAGGFIGTLVWTTIVNTASARGHTRMDVPFLLGTVFTDNRRKARAVGYALHFVAGLFFVFPYAMVFTVVGYSSWWLGTLLGVLHAVFVGTILVNVLLPAVHPLMGTPETAANEIALIEPPGFLMLNYGRNTFLVLLAAHMAYGAIVGWVVR